MAERLNGKTRLRIKSPLDISNNITDEPSSAELSQAEEFEREVLKGEPENNQATDDVGYKDTYYVGGQLLSAQFDHKILTPREERAIADSFVSSRDRYTDNMLSVGKSAGHILFLINSAPLLKKQALIYKLFHKSELVKVQLDATTVRVSEVLKELSHLLSREDAYSSGTQRKIWQRREEIKERFLPWNPKLSTLDLLLEGDAYFPGVKACADLLEGKLSSPNTNPKELRRIVSQELVTTPGEIIIFAREGEKAKNIAYMEREKLILLNQRLVLSIAKKYAYMHPSNPLITLPDLVSEGNEGLFKAIEKFEPERGYKLSTYSVWWIKQGITRYIADRQSTVRRPVHLLELSGKLAKRIKLFQQQNNTDELPNFDELAEEWGETAEKIQSAFEARKTNHSFDLQFEEGSKEDAYSAFGDQKAPSPVNESSAHLLSETVDRVLTTLPERERTILRYRFGFEDGGRIHTLEELGKKYKLTRERIRQIEAKALKRLRHPERKTQLQGEFDALEGGEY